MNLASGSFYSKKIFLCQIFFQGKTLHEVTANRQRTAKTADGILHQYDLKKDISDCLYKPDKFYEEFNEHNI